MSPTSLSQRPRGTAGSRSALGEQPSAATMISKPWCHVAALPLLK